MYYSPLQLAAMAYNLSSDQTKLIIDRYKSNLSVLAILAARPDLDPENAALLSKSSNIKVRRRALTKVSDVSLLRKALDSSYYSASVASNTHTPAEILDYLLRNGTHFAQIRAACNPSTPEESRKEVLKDDKLVTKLVYVGTPIASRVVRSHELVNNNTWLLNSLDFDKYDLNIKRAIIGNYRTSVETVNHAVKSLRSPNNWSSLANHPYRKGLDFASQPFDNLAKTGCAAADLYLLEHPMLDVDTASLIVNSGFSYKYSINPPHSRVSPEPHIVALLAKRFGNLCFKGSEPLDGGLAVTRISSAAWKEPCVHYYMNVTNPDPLEVAGVLDTLGTNEALWDTFVALSVDWKESLTQLAEVCSRV